MDVFKCNNLAGDRELEVKFRNNRIEIGIQEEKYHCIFISIEDAVKLRKLLPKPKDKQSKLEELLDFINVRVVSNNTTGLEKAFWDGYNTALQHVSDKIKTMKGK
jgi:hypothetical protein